jgi:phospholipase D1/2
MTRDRRRVAILLATAVTALLLVYATPLRRELDFDKAAELGDWAHDLGPFGPIAFLGITALGVTVGAPRLFFAGLGGYLFGFWPGFVSAQFGTLIGSFVTFLYGRALGREYVDERLGSRFARLRGALELVGDHGVFANVLARNIPIGNSFVMTLAMSVSPMPLADFTLGTFLGTAPGAAICAYFCDGAHGDISKRLAVAGGLVLVLALVSYFGLRRTHLARALAATVEPAASDETRQPAGQKSDP